jgi:glycosyltransferase involved in cell wall biosynthesis
MRIVHILPGLTRGGAEELLIHLIQQLPQHEHHVLYVYDGLLKQRLIDAGAQMHHIQGMFFSYDLFYFYHLIKKLRFLSPGCIHAILWSSSIIARVIGKVLSIPVVCGMHARKIHDGIARIYAQRLVSISPARYIAASKGIAQDVIQYHGVDENKIVIIENGITIPATIEKQANACISLLAIGRFVPFKNFSQLLIIFKQIVQERPHVHLTLVGWGPLENELKAQVQELDLENHVTFAVNQSAVPYLKTADIFIQPSWEEGLSIALLEALAYECAVIVSGKNHHHEIIHHHIDGVVIDPTLINEFALTIIQLIDNAPLRKKLSRAGRDLVENHFNIAHVARQYDAIFMQSASKNRSRT